MSKFLLMDRKQANKIPINDTFILKKTGNNFKSCQ